MEKKIAHTLNMVMACSRSGLSTVHLVDFKIKEKINSLDSAAFESCRIIKNENV